MSYTPPSGSAVNYQFLGAGYSAPAGGSVAFSFAVTGSVAEGVPLSGWAVSTHGVLGAASCSPLGASAIGQFPFVGTARTHVELNTSAAGVVYAAGVVAGSPPLAAIAAGVGTVQAAGGTDLPLSALATTAAAAVGETLEGVALTGLATCLVAMTGCVGNVDDVSPTAPGKLQLSAECEGLAAPTARGQAKIGVAVGVVGRVGCTAGVLARLPLGSAFYGAHGRAGISQSTFMVSGGALAQHGMAGAALSALQLTAGGAATAPLSTQAFANTPLDLRASADGFSPLAEWVPGIRVRTKRAGQRVTTA